MIGTLVDHDEPPFSVIAGGSSPFLFIGDHAGAAVPASLGDLGLPPEAFGRHIAIDIGVAGLGERLAARLDATFIAQRYSRLVIDCNRDPSRADSVCEVSDGTVIPGNHGLSPTDRQARIDAVFAPYHARIAAELDRRQAAGRPTVLVALHSFTPVMAGHARPWRYGVLHLHDSPFSTAALRALRDAFGEAVVGDNQPYSMTGIDFTVPHHAIARGIDYLELEVRQDLLETAAGQDEIADVIAGVLTGLTDQISPARPIVDN